MTKDHADRRRARRSAVVGTSVLQRRRAEQLLTDELRVDVVHTCPTIRELLIWLRRTDRSRWPHILITEMPSGRDSASDLNAIGMLREAGMRTVVLAAHTSRSALRQLTSRAVEGIIAATDTEADFVAVVAAVLSGRNAIAPQARMALVDPPNAPRLSVQEQRVLELYASGLTIGEVAVRIGVRQDTARKYLNRVKAKYAAFGRPARTKLELARLAWADGYVQSAGGDPAD